MNRLFAPHPARRRRLAWAVALAVAIGLVVPGLLDGTTSALAADEGPAPTRAPAAWPEEVVELWAKTPVQQGGRTMPLYSWATYALLRVNHKKTMKLGRVTTTLRAVIGIAKWLKVPKEELAALYGLKSTELLDAVY